MGAAPPLQQPVIHPHSNGQTTAAAVTAATIPVIMEKRVTLVVTTVAPVPQLNIVVTPCVIMAKHAIPVVKTAAIVNMDSVATSSVIMENHAIPAVRIVVRVPFVVICPAITAKTVTPVLETAEHVLFAVMGCVTIGKHVTLAVRIAVYASSVGTGSVITEKPVCIVRWIAANVSPLRLPIHRNRRLQAVLLLPPNVATVSVM